MKQKKKKMNKKKKKRRDSPVAISIQQEKNAEKQENEQSLPSEF